MNPTTIYYKQEGGFSEKRKLKRKFQPTKQTKKGVNK